MPAPTERSRLLAPANGSSGHRPHADLEEPPPPSGLDRLGRQPSTHKLWEGWGNYDEDLEVDEGTLLGLAKELEQRRQGEHGELLGEWRASSICANDILSSCFYTIGLVTSYSGKLVGSGSQ